LSTEESDPRGERLLRSPSETEIDLSVVEGLRLITAFSKIGDSADRRIIIELAERLAK
jgi:hypothetical protein